MKIKFSHHYVKMPSDFKTSVLTDIEIIHLENFCKSFIERDTAITGGGHYKLPSTGKFMLLSLRSLLWGRHWQTIRRWTPRKEAYYRSHVGEIVSCEIVGKG
jgi:hypothetical protein